MLILILLYIFHYFIGTAAHLFVFTPLSHFKFLRAIHFFYSSAYNSHSFMGTKSSLINIFLQPCITHWVSTELLSQVYFRHYVVLSIFQALFQIVVQAFSSWILHPGGRYSWSDLKVILSKSHSWRGARLGLELRSLAPEPTVVGD